VKYEVIVHLPSNNASNKTYQRLKHKQSDSTWMMAEQFLNKGLVNPKTTVWKLPSSESTNNRSSLSNSLPRSRF